MLYDNYVVLKVILSSKQLKLVYKKKRNLFVWKLNVFNILLY